MVLHGEKVKGNNVLPHAIGHSNKKKMLSDSNLKNKSEEVVEHNSTPTVYDIILDSSSKPDEQGTDPFSPIVVVVVVVVVGMCRKHIILMEYITK